MCGGLLLHYVGATSFIFGAHSLDKFSRMQVVAARYVNIISRMYLISQKRGEKLVLSATLEGVGLQRVRRVQRWWRRLRWQKQALSLMMGMHKRLGAQSKLYALEVRTVY
jgi:hypothetical protein